MSGPETEFLPTIFKKCGGKLAQERAGTLLPETPSETPYRPPYVTPCRAPYRATRVLLPLSFVMINLLAMKLQPFDPVHVIDWEKW